MLVPFIMPPKIRRYRRPTAEEYKAALDNWPWYQEHLRKHRQREAERARKERIHLRKIKQQGIAMLARNEFHGIESLQHNELRYFMYLTRRPGWVLLGGEPHQFQITHEILKDEQPALMIDLNSFSMGSMMAMAFREQPRRELSAAEIEAIHVKAAKEADYCFSNSASSSSGTGSTKSFSLSEFKVRKFSYAREAVSYNRLHIADTYVAATMKNFDAYYLEEMANFSKKERKVMMDAHKANKALAVMAAKKNAIWMAAASGDSKQLKLLLDEFPEVDLHSTYAGRSLVQAMFQADPQKDFPFKNNKPNYVKCLEHLVAHGFDEKQVLQGTSMTSANWLHGQKTQGAQAAVFSATQAHQAKLLAIFDKQFNLKEEQVQEVPRLTK